MRDPSLPGLPRANSASLFSLFVAIISHMGIRTKAAPGFANSSVLETTRDSCETGVHVHAAKARYSQGRHGPKLTPKRAPASRPFSLPRLATVHVPETVPLNPQASSLDSLVHGAPLNILG